MKKYSLLVVFICVCAFIYVHGCACLFLCVCMGTSQMQCKVNWRIESLMAK